MPVEPQDVHLVRFLISGLQHSSKDVFCPRHIKQALFNNVRFDLSNLNICSDQLPFDPAFVSGSRIISLGYFSLVQGWSWRQKNSSRILCVSLICAASGKG